MSNPLEPLVFDDLSPAEIPVTIGTESYTLREASGDVACQYRNALLACTQLGPEGKPSRIRDMADVEPLLVSLCLFDAQGKLVPLAVIRRWPHRIQKSLFNRAQEISNIDEEDDIESLIKQQDEINEKIIALKKGEDKAKNLPSGTMDGSD